MMAGNPEAGRDDLAYLRGVLEDRRPGMRIGGLLYGAAGLIYGTQVLLVAADLSGVLPLGDVHGWAAVVANILFFGLIAATVWTNRHQLEVRGTANRAIAAGFAGVGFANAAAAAAFALVMMRTGNAEVWLLFPVVVSAFQGAVWYLFAALARRFWMGAVAAGWFAAALAAGALIDRQGAYFLVFALALYLLMALPGLALLRAAGSGRS
ncbi:hypothetical protein ACFOGJ_23495 [Marinibaculum pumilum]|uniref:Uncharacterized protein n=1 Tax=Marinibaculum pumilum TaxID=1766165 RepID=A0ABV7L785_9PROT